MTRETRGDRIFLFINATILTIVLVVIAYPLVFVISASVSDPDMVYQGRVWLYPRGFTLEGFQRVLQNQDIWLGYRNTIIYTVAGTLINLAVTLPCAYALSRRDLLGAGMISLVFAFTMFFTGGIIPRYLVVNGLGLTNTVWAMLLPNAATMWYIIIARTYLQNTIPQSLLDAGKIDGASDIHFFARIVLPLSSPVIAVLALFYGVMHWNSYFDALIFLSNRRLIPLQLVLREILIISEMGSSDMLTIDDAEVMSRMARIAELVKYAVMIVSTIPVLAAYPFIQKYFAKGVMLGALKG